MKSILASAAAVLVVLSFVGVVCAAESDETALRTISAAEIKAGMTGYGLTCIKGETPQRFEVNVLGVISKKTPRNAILVKATGLGLEHSGIFGGMSGSPVYIDSRLAGAVAFGWGWPKDAVGGVTPIADMLEGARMPVVKRAGTAVWESLEIERVAAGEGFATLPPAGGIAGRASAAFAPVTMAVPGLSSQAREVIEHYFPPERFMLAEGAVGGAGEETQGKPTQGLSPGSNVFAALISGDFNMGAVGTVTEVSGEDVYAFGHPLFNFGEVAIPMCTANVLTVFASTQRSFKIARPTAEVGAIVRDYATGIHGRLGAKAETFPVTVTLVQGPRRDVYNYTVFRHFAVTPQLVASVVAESVTNYGDLPPESSVAYELRVDYAGEWTLALAREIAGASSVMQMSGDVGALLRVTMFNPIEKLVPESVHISVNVEGGDLSAWIDSASVGENEVRAGETLHVLARIRPALAEPFTVPLEVIVPAGTAPGNYSLMVCDGGTSNVIDLKEAKNRLKPKTVEALLDTLTPRRSAREVVARLSAAGLGLARGDHELPDLPPSALAVLAPAGETSISPVFTSAVAAKTTGFVLSGKEVVPVVVKEPLEEE